MEPSSVSCICELCDCGRHKHHKDCKKTQRVRPRGTNGECYISHYKATFNVPKYVPLRSSKRPLYTPVPRNLPPMNLVTTQRTEFIPKPIEGRPKPYIPPDGYYQSPEEPLISQTVYGLHYPPKEAERTMLTRPPDNLRPLPASSLQHSTTNKEQYKQWKTERPPQYGELPTLAGSLLFPGDVRDMKTTTQDHFVEKKLKKVEPVKSSQDHLAMEGEHFMTTTHQSTFHPLPLEKKQIIKESLLKNVIKRSPVELMTKYQSDFSGCHTIEPSRPALPPTDNLTVNPFYSNDFQTVQRAAYPGWNPLLHPRPEPAQLKEELTAMDRERGGQVEGNTVTKLAFLPHEPLPKEPSKRPRSVLRPINARFDGTTHSRSVFQDWGIQPRRRYGDPVDGVSMKPLVKLDSETTTGSTFIPRKGEPMKKHKPAKDNLDLTGDQDFSTVHKETYRTPELPRCRMQVFLDQQMEMKSSQPQKSH
ncbi:stabilizer of axonemal microtubules 1-like [Bufo bufo]|uniref:stabilizer of axonemal microtubules 1-like n=1 Tax=Bufo bufo TaxID=8384 RepID=UPI001ABE154F|nr:stabilizer of axonemal microtubules 1-like [Bufo bufo]